MSNRILEDFINRVPDYTEYIPTPKVKEEDDEFVKSPIIENFVEEQKKQSVVAGNTENTNKKEIQVPLTVLDMMSMYAPEGENDPDKYADSVVSFINSNYQDANVDSTTNIFDINKDYLKQAIANVEGFYKTKEWNLANNGREGNLPQDWNNPGMLEYHEQPGATPSPEVRDSTGKLLYKEGRFAKFDSIDSGFAALDTQVELYQTRARERYNLDIQTKLGLQNSLNLDIGDLSKKMNEALKGPSPIAESTGVSFKPANPKFLEELTRGGRSFMEIALPAAVGSVLEMAGTTSPKEKTATTIGDPTRQLEGDLPPGAMRERYRSEYQRTGVSTRIDEGITEEEARRRTEENKSYIIGNAIRKGVADYYMETPELHAPENMVEFSWGTMLDPGVMGRLIGQGLPTVLLSSVTAAGATVATGGNVVAGLGAGMATAGFLEGGLAYDEAVKYGLDPWEAREVAVAVGGINAMLESMPIAGILKKSGLMKAYQKSITQKLAQQGLSGKLTKEGFSQAVTESITEATQEFVNVQAELSYLNEADSKELKQQAWNRILESGYGGGLVGGGTGLGASAYSGYQTKSGQNARNKVIKAATENKLSQLDNKVLAKGLLNLTREERMELGLTQEEIQLRYQGELKEALVEAASEEKKEHREERSLDENAPSPMSQVGDTDSYISDDEIIDSKVDEIIGDQDGDKVGETNEAALRDFDELDLADISINNGQNVVINEYTEEIYEPLVGNKYVINGKEYIVNKNTDEDLYEISPTGKIEKNEVVAEKKQDSEELIEDTKKTTTENVTEEEVLTDEVAKEAPLDTSKMFVKDLQKALKDRNLPIREGGKLLNKKQLKQRLDDAIAKEQAPEQTDVTEETSAQDEIKVGEPLGVEIDDARKITSEQQADEEFADIDGPPPVDQISEGEPDAREAIELQDEMDAEQERKDTIKREQDRIDSQKKSQTPTETLSEEELKSVNFSDIIYEKTEKPLKKITKNQPKSTKDFKKAANTLDVYIKNNNKKPLRKKSVAQAKKIRKNLNTLLKNRGLEFDSKNNVVKIKTAEQIAQDKKDLESKKKAAIKKIGQDKKERKKKFKAKIKAIKTKKKTTPKTETKEYSNAVNQLETRIDNEGVQSIIEDTTRGQKELKGIDARTIKQLAEKRGIDVSKIKTSKRKMLEAIREDIVLKRKKPKISNEQAAKIKLNVRDISTADNAAMDDKVVGGVENIIITKERIADPNITPAKRRQYEESLIILEETLKIEKQRLIENGKRLYKEALARGEEYTGVKSLKEANKLIRDTEKQTKEGIAKEKEEARSKNVEEKLKELKKVFTAFSKLENSGYMDSQARKQMSRDISKTEQELIELGVSEQDINNLKSEVTTKVEEDARKDDFDDSDSPFGGEPTEADLKLTEDLIENGNRFGDDTGSYRVSQRLEDAAIVGSELILRGFNQLKTFVPEMVRRYGNTIRPYAKKIFKKAKKYVENYIDKFRTGELAFGLSIKDISKQPLTKEEQAKLDKDATPRQKEDKKEWKAEYDKIDNMSKKDYKLKSKKDKKASKNEAFKLVKDLGMPISERAKKIHVSMKRALREYMAVKDINLGKDNIKISPFKKKLKNLLLKSTVNVKIKNDLRKLDLALVNGDIETANEIAKKYNMDKELQEVRGVLKDLFNRAQSAGYKMFYQVNYFPRFVKKGKVSEYRAYLYGPTMDLKGVLSEAIQYKEMKLGRRLTEEEEIEVYNNYLSKNSKAKKAPGFTKGRSVRNVDNESLDFYENSLTSLIQYVEQSNENIARQVFFGKGVDINGRLSESIGDKVNLLMREGSISEQEQEVVKAIFTTLFNKQTSSGGANALRSLTYMLTITDALTILNTTMEVGINAIDLTTIDDPLGFVRATIKQTLGSKNKITMEDLGVGERISQEMSNPVGLNRILRTQLFANGFNWMDRVNKEVLVNGAIDKLRKQARKYGDPSKIEIRGKDRFDKRMYAMKLTDIFGVDKNGNLKSNIVEDLKNNKKSNDVLFLAYNILLDKQPISDTEMPKKYIDSNGWGRTFYALKTWSIKQLSVIRERKLDRIRLSRNKVEGVNARIDMLYYMTMLSYAGASGTALSAFITGGEVDFEDHVHENFLRMIFLSKYNINTFVDSGRLDKIFVDGIAPAFLKLSGNAAADIMLYLKWDFGMFGGISNSEKSKKYGYTYPNMLPLIGNLYYNGARGIPYLVEEYGLEGLRGRKSYLQREINDLEEVSGIKTTTEKKLLGKIRDLTEEEETRLGLLKDELEDIKAYEKGERIKRWESLDNKPLKNRGYSRLAN